MKITYIYNYTYKKIVKKAMVYGALEKLAHSLKFFTEETILNIQK